MNYCSSIWEISWLNDYQKYLLGVGVGVGEGGRYAEDDNLATIMCRFSRNRGNLKLLEHKGPVWYVQE